ncbi:MAG: hypothetical protein AB1918_18195 [Pseudomonadota bacterium]
MTAATLLRISGLRLLSLGVAALFVAALPMVMPPEEYGRFNLALSILQTGAAVLLSWPNQALLRFGREEFTARGVLGEVLGTRLVLHAVLLVPALGLALGAAGQLADWANLDAATLRWTLAVGLPLLSLSDLGIFAAQAAGAFGGYGWAPLALRLAQLAGLGLLAASGGGWHGLMAATLAGYGAGAWLAWRSIPGTALAGLRASPAMARRMLAYGRLQVLAICSAFLLNWIDLWLLRAFLDMRAVGTYAWAYSVTLVAMTLLVPLAAVVAPHAIDRLRAGDHVAVRGQMAAVGSACVLLAALLPAGCGVLAAALSLPGLGAYSEAVRPVLLLLAGTVFQLGSAAVEPVVYADERAAPGMAGVAMTMVAVNAVADLVLIPVLGVAGPAVGTAAAYGVGMVLIWRRAGRLVGAGPSPLPFVAWGLSAVAAAGLLAMLPPLPAVMAGMGGSVLAMAVARGTGMLKALQPLAAGMPGKLRHLIGWLAAEGA